MGFFKTRDERTALRVNKTIRQESIIELDKQLRDYRKQLIDKIEELHLMQSSLVDKQMFLKATQEQNAKLLTLEKNLYSEIGEKYLNTIKELFKNNREYIDEKSNEITALHDTYSPKLLEFEKQLTDLQTIKADHMNITAKLAEQQTNLEKMKQLEQSYKDVALNLLEQRINSEQLLTETADKSAKLMLEAFNAELVSFNQKEQKTISEAIRNILERHNVLKNFKAEEEVKKLGKNELLHEQYAKVKNIVLAGIIPMVVGPAGSGKSHAMDQLARELGLNFYMANRIQNTFELVGFVNAAGEYVTTQFYEAYNKGGLFFFDEVDASSPEALVTINAAIAQGYMAFPGHANNMKMHPDFKVVAAGNTYGTGQTLIHTGRNKLDAATLDRFMIVDWKYDDKLEDSLIKDKDLLNMCRALREVCAKYYNIIISTRGIITIEKMIHQEKKVQTMKIEELFKQKFFAHVEKKEMAVIFDNLKTKNVDKNKYFSIIEKTAMI